MRRFNRKTAPKVRNGKVQRKNRWELSRHYRHYPQNEPFIDRLEAGPGYRHLLRKADVRRFISLLPDWPELSRGLDAIILAPGEEDCLGWHVPGMIAVCAWERKLWQKCRESFIEESREILERLDVSWERLPGGRCLVKWTETGARAFQLMDVLLHELGHHHDRMTTRSRTRVSRGEPYAEEYARRYAARIWDDYFRVFGW